MSVYDFNNHLNENNNSNTIKNNNNNNNNNNSHAVHSTMVTGVQQTRYQHHVENDYTNSGFSSSQHLEMSVELTRPTSKTALLVRQRRAMLEQVSCYLCKGYLIDATTIDECMDSFCKSCIVNYLHSHNNCPKCGTLLHETNPLSTIHSDKVLQEIVYKLVPGLYDDEMRRRREFYRNHYGTSSSEDEDGSTSSSINGRYSHLNSEQHGAISHPKPFYKPTDNIDLSIEPQTKDSSSAIYYDNTRQSIVTCFTGNVQRQEPIRTLFSSVDSQQFKTFLRCPAKLTVVQLKKFIAAKFNTCRDDTIHLFYLNESLKDEYSLIDIAYIYDWRGIEHMRLFYTIERDLTNFNDLHGHQIESQPSKRKISHSIGTSTQTVKRVCIDPHPKFYEEHNNNVATYSSSSGRNMRSRDTQSSPTSKSTASQSSQAPILRSYSANKEESSFSIGQQVTVNGVTNRELASLRRDDTSDQSQFTNAVSTAIDELSRLKHGAPKETRSSTRKNTLESTTSGSNSPKISISSNSSTGTVSTYSRANNDSYSTQRYTPRQQHQQQVLTASRHTVVPFVRKGYTSASTTISGSQPSSMVTLANFTQIRNNKLVTTSAATGNTSGNYTKSDGAPDRLDNAKSTTKEVTTSAISKSSQPPDVAYSIVTGKGITIVLNSQNDALRSPTSNSTIRKTGLDPVSLGGNNSHAIRNNMNQQKSMSSQSLSSAVTSHPSVSTSNRNHQAETNNQVHQGQQHESTSARHLTKVKPVYKTFVDPTKLKSPNFKKLGYTTARQ